MGILNNIIDWVANKIRNLIYNLSKKEEVIENQGTVRYPKWVLSSSKKMA
jgi:hypothetical protein